MSTDPTHAQAAAARLVGEMQYQMTVTMDRTESGITADQVAARSAATDNNDYRLDVASQLYADNAISTIATAAVLNESANANNYISDIADAEHAKISRNIRVVQRDQHKLTQNLLQSERLSNYYTQGTGVIFVVMTITYLLLVLGMLYKMGRISIATMLIAAGLSSIFLVIYVALVARYAIPRRAAFPGPEDDKECDS